ncbi:putative valacyclovir hydrolase protein [Botrytis fragariae]|uniref:Putative valacyclovir hydrolase protein n=1 Tax=Botrytis fragariae TaxID=1964551 RepID=A0A8H6AJ16_9HELO|nr:putative valacyclovir hydrolase protein [Botrytis fragariae]KAF5868643.1 putative valacyclovir hydrolase protein [Botrytis fragariae]
MTTLSLPPPFLINGLSYIPPPSAKAFEEEFAGILPPGKDILSSRGIIHYYDFNPSSSSNAKKVLLIHGIGTCAIGIAPLARQLTSSGSHVVIYDLWGHGNSSTPLEAHTPALMHVQIFEVLSHLGWSKAHFVGFSLGGSILATFAALYPHVVESAVVVAGAGLWKKKNSGWWNRLQEDGDWMVDEESDHTIIEELEGFASSNRNWKNAFRQGEFVSQPIEQWQRENHKGHVVSVVSIFRYGNVFDQHESYRKLIGSGIKILVIVGEFDTSFPPEFVKRELGELGWGREILQVDGAGHSLVRTHEEVVGRFIEEFWEREFGM